MAGEGTPLLHGISSIEPDIGVDEIQVDGDDKTSQSLTTLRCISIIFSLFILIFLQAANASLLTTTQSTIAGDLDAYSNTSWFTSAYLIPMSSLAPVTGRLAQLFSPRLVIYTSTLIFSVGHLVSSQARELLTFLAGRTITGIGAAGILSVSIIVALEMGGEKKRGFFVGLVNAVFTLGLSLGAVVAGGLMPHIGWRAVFWVQAPASLIGGTCLFLSIPVSFYLRKITTTTQTVKARLASIDFLGAIALTSSIVLLLVALSSPEVPVVLILISIVIMSVFVVVELYIASEPIIPITLLNNRGVLLTCLATLGEQISRWVVIFYTPIYEIAVRGWSLPSAGSILIPTNVGFAVGGLLVGFFHVRRGGSFYVACVMTYVLFPPTLLLLAYLSQPSSSTRLYIISTFFNGFITGAGINYTLAHVLHLTPKHTHFMVTSLIATFRGLAGSFGSAAGGSIFSRLLRSSLKRGFEVDGGLGKAEQEVMRQLLGSPALVWQMTGAKKSIAVRGYVDAVQGVFLAGSMLAVGMIMIQAGTGWQTSDRVPVAEDPGIEPAID